MALEFGEGGHVIVPKGIGNKKKFFGKDVVVSIRGKEGYVFDEGGWEKFDKEFDCSGQIYINDKGYIIRKHNGTKESFHRWLMAEEVREFCEKNDCEPEDVEVDHMNINNKDNRKENLRVLLKKDHRFRHREEGAWVWYRKKNSAFWDKGKGEDYYRENFRYRFRLGEFSLMG